MLLWQDMPLQWGYARSVRWQAQRQATEMVALLAHHPSVAVWCAHNEPLAIEVDAEDLADPRGIRRVGMRYLAAQQLPR